MTETRPGAVTFKGNPITLQGNALKPGDRAPDFKLVTNGLEEVTLANYPGKTLILVAVPSLDTSVCQLETKRFNEEAAKLPGVQILVVSMDLPFAQKRWCGAEGITNLQTVSAHRCTQFGKDYGALIEGGALHRILCRAIFVVGSDGSLKHVEYVSEITQHPNYEAALKA